MKIKPRACEEEAGDHPIFNPYGLFIDTKMIDRMEASIMHLLWSGEIGCLVIGDSRYGKTRAIGELKDRLKDKLGSRVSSHVVSISRRDKKTVKALFRRLCKSIGVNPHARASSDDMEDIVLAHMIDEMLIYKQNKLVLFVDEIQRLSFDQIDSIASFHDRLADDYKKTLFVVFIGNHGTSDHLLDSIKTDKDKVNLRKRFFRHEYLFSGIRDQKELSYCLRQYDFLRFPTEVGPTYTEFFLNQVVGDGWKLESLAPDIWNIFQDEYARPYNISSWGMQYFLATIKTLLTHYLPKYGVECKSEIEDMIRQSIASSCLIEDLVVEI